MCKIDLVDLIFGEVYIFQGSKLSVKRIHYRINFSHMNSQYVFNCA